MMLEKNYNIIWRRNGKPEYVWDNVEDTRIIQNY